MKRKVGIFLVMLFTVVFGLTSYAKSWYRSGVEYKHYRGVPGNIGEECNAQIKIVGSRNELWIDGEKQYNQWIAISANLPNLVWMYFDKDGKTLSNWQQVGGNWYYFSSGGVASSGGWHRIDGEYYYFDPETRALKTSGTEKRDGVTYEFSADGRSTKVDGLKSAGEDGTEGWKRESHGWYYLRDGQKVTSEWLYDGDIRYYVGEDGKMYGSAHFIDGYFYLFDGSGKVMVGGHTYHRGTKYVLGEGGRGIPTEMTPGEQMYSSATVEWCKDTYRIYFDAEGLYRAERSKHSDILAERMKQQWGVSSGEECITTIQRLFESAKASDNKAEKAWDFSRAMSLSWVGPMIGWWSYETSVNMQVEMAPAIQQSFTSWDDFNDCYMEGFTRWCGGSGETYEKRVKAYNSLKEQGHFVMDWNTELKKTW